MLKKLNLLLGNEQNSLTIIICYFDIMVVICPLEQSPTNDERIFQVSLEERRRKQCSKFFDSLLLHKLNFIQITDMNFNLFC